MKIPEVQKVRTELDTRKICSLKKIINDAARLKESVFKYQKRYGDDLTYPFIDYLNSLSQNIDNELNKINQNDQNLINGGLCVI